METIKTIKVKPSHPSQGDHVLINEHDFDPEIHERIDRAPRKAEPKPAEPAKPKE